MCVQFKAVLVVDPALPGNGRMRGAAQITALERVANRPIIYHALDDVLRADAESVIVVGDADTLIDVQVGLRDYEPGLERVEFAVCRGHLSLAGIVEAAAPFVGGYPCLLQTADGLWEEPIHQVVELLGEESADVLLLVAPELNDPERAAIGNASRVPTLVGIGRARTELAWLAAGTMCAPNGHSSEPAVASLETPDMPLGPSVRVRTMGGWHRYSGDGRDLLELNRIALDALATHIPAAARVSNRLEGRLLIDPSADVTNSAIIGPTVIGPGATIKDAYVGPYTSIGAYARIEGAEIERSIVSTGASVTHVGGRLVASLVGRDARIFRDFSLPRALRLWVGDGDEIALC
jgi:glucose-1-phosphate thymidylyltransferase